jgi:hypothetical protein
MTTTTNQERDEAMRETDEWKVVAAAEGLPLVDRMKLLLANENLTFAECSLAEEWAQTMRTALSVFDSIDTMAMIAASETWDKAAGGVFLSIRDAIRTVETT